MSREIPPIIDDGSPYWTHHNDYSNFTNITNSRTKPSKIDYSIGYQYPEFNGTLDGQPTDLGVGTPTDMYGNAGDFSKAAGVLQGAMGLMANANKISQDYSENPLKAGAINIPTSQYGLLELSRMPYIESKDKTDFGYKSVVGDVMSGAVSGAASGASLGPYGALAGAIVGGIINGGAASTRNYMAKINADEYEKNRQINERNRMYALDMGTKQIRHDRSLDYDRGFVFANGGPLDATNGVTFFPTGGSHEQNPNGGIYQGMSADGQPNLVEEGEVKWKDYIFPVRMKPTKSLLKEFNLDPKMVGKNYAEIATEIQKESEDRPNDPVYGQTMDEMMGRLRACHEEHQMRKQAREMMKMMESLPPEAQMQMFQQMGVGQSMPQQQMPMQPQLQEQMPLEQPEQMMDQEQPMAAYGGKQIGHRYAGGGDLNRFMKMMGFNTKSEYEKWLADNNAELPISFDDNTVDWEKLVKSDVFMNYMKTSDPSLYHAIKAGYLTDKRDEAQEASFHTEKGHWINPTGESWNGSLDAAWLEALEAAKADGIDLTRANTRTLEKYLGATEAYNKSTDWLRKDEANRLTYLNSVINSEYTSPAAKSFAKKFVDDKGNWRKGVKKDYDTIFGITRGKDPGDYWKSVYGALREQEVNNLVLNPETGEYEILYGNPGDYEKDGSYDWANGLKDITNNYYSKKPSSDSPVVPAESPILEYEPMTPYPKYSMLPGLGAAAINFMGAFNQPDYTKANALDAFQWQPMDYTPIGDYMRYEPLDENYMTNVMRGHAGATRRALGNQYSPSTNAAMLAADFNAMSAIGDSIAKMREYNDKQKGIVAEFNRGTNKYNADQANTAEQANFGLQPYMYSQAKDVAEARDAATTLASEANSKALSGTLSALGEAYKADYANQQLEWLLKNHIIEGVTTK